jgi:hypothetical protein
MKDSSFGYEKRKRLLLISVSDYIIINVHCEHLIEQIFHIIFDICPKRGPGPFLGKPLQTAFYQMFQEFLSFCDQVDFCQLLALVL